MTLPETIVLAHGGGGLLTQQLIADLIIPELGDPSLLTLGDSALLDLPTAQIAFTTDSFVVQPLFFPGGDIGTLAVCGTVNDLAVAGAKPYALSLSLILEEGFSIADLRTVLQSVRHTAEEAGVQLVTGDTKVLPRGEAQGLFINTAGIGIRYPDVRIDPRAITEGDAIILSGPIAAHGCTIIARRNKLQLTTSVVSDVAPLGGLVEKVIATCPEVKVMRDATRGGVAAVLNELALAAGIGIELDEAALPIDDNVQRICDLLGFDPLEVANEGVAVVVCPERKADAVVAAIRTDPHGRAATRVGRAVAGRSHKVILNTRVGGRRLVEMPYGESLPRIC